MSNFFKKVFLVFQYGAELEAILKEKKDAADKAEREAEIESNRYRLNLCFKHRQEESQSWYSEGNCDHCRLLRLNAQLHSALDERDNPTQGSRQVWP